MGKANMWRKGHMIMIQKRKYFMINYVSNSHFQFDQKLIA
jgi:hypothetical protein